MAEENEATPEETEITATEEGDDEFHPFDEVRDAFVPRAVPMVEGPDGMPAFVHPEGKSDIPVLSEETLVCMGDFRWFVRRHDPLQGYIFEAGLPRGSIVEKFNPNAVEQHPSGEWVVAAENVRVWAVNELRDVKWVVVEPIRPPCRHYVRQLAQFELNPEHKTHVRLCAARRTTEGAFMTVRDTAIWACSMREPRDLQSEQLMHDFDEQKKLEGANRTEHSIFRDGDGIFGGLGK